MGEYMVAHKSETDLKRTGAKRKRPGTVPKVEFRIFGEEMIEKQVKASGKTGRIYLPPDWVGKHVKIIRIN